MSADTHTEPSAELAAATGRYLLDVTAKREPYELLTQLREGDAVHRSDAGTWIISGYDLSIAVLRDSRFSRAAATERDVEINFDAGEAAEVYRHKMINREGADHTRLRRILTPAFTPAAARRWRPYIEQVVDEVFDEVAPRREGEIVHDLSYPIPEHVICTMLGVPAEDHKLFEEWTRILNARPQAGESDDERRRLATAALAEFIEYLRALIARRRGDLRDDLVSQLITLEEEGDRLNERELVAVMTEIINGGHDTTASTITNGTFMLTQHPAQFDRLKADPSLVPSAVEEVLRFRSPVQLSLTRRTTDDVEIAGVIIPRGSTVVVALAGANREPGKFEEPDTFDIGRTPNRHLAFGNGGHFCLGAHLARVELDVAFDRIARRLPGLHLTIDVADLTWRTTTLVMAPAALPVTW